MVVGILTRAPLVLARSLSLNVMRSRMMTTIIWVLLLFLTEEQATPFLPIQVWQGVETSSYLAMIGMRH